MQTVAAPSTGEGCTAPPAQLAHCYASYASRGLLFCSNLLQALQLGWHKSGTDAVNNMYFEAAASCTDIRERSRPLPILNTAACCMSAEASLQACLIQSCDLPAADASSQSAATVLDACTKLLVPACRDEFTNFFFLQRKVATLADRQEWRFFAQVTPSGGCAGIFRSINWSSG